MILNKERIFLATSSSVMFIQIYSNHPKRQTHHQPIQNMAAVFLHVLQLSEQVIS